MSRLDYCQYELVDDCYDWKNDNCDECNIFKAYCEGARRAKSALPSADVVSREKYDAVCEEYNRLVHNAICRNMCDENCKYEKGNTCYHAREHYAIDSVVSAEAVQGEWKRVETRTYKGECTNCGFRHIFMDGHDSQYRFCPYCGAKMTKGGDSE